MGKIALFSFTKRNRECDLTEWLDYYLAIGFDNIYVVDNGSKFSVKKVVEDNQKYKNVIVNNFNNFASTVSNSMQNISTSVGQQNSTPSISGGLRNVWTELVIGGEL